MGTIEGKAGPTPSWGRGGSAAFPEVGPWAEAAAGTSLWLWCGEDVQPGSIRADDGEEIWIKQLEEGAGLEAEAWQLSAGK